MVFIFINSLIQIIEIISYPIGTLNWFALLKLTIHEFKGRINAPSDHFENSFVHVNETTEEDPKIKRVKKPSKQTLLVSQNVLETVFSVLLKRCKLIGDIVFL